ncbi:MAG: adenylyl-sulfate kinase [Nitrososphaerota archaeon]|nr:adenylyl-sulfate kinase [Nitrososphaerota archaeon]MDG6961621.1 adenylyl-sulfate kinase [Nitrososphaerota archaeon]MDG7005269.1 adenylyl-sulfate kinase [Nitrososphaerota archaeon]MDG7032657.1 adenylyl-sulfate kinase [Nitrososphaerota archaeon]MDG7034404.1 adenylyl-sulfate kinase [Nitrososphaerota archaeon]
MVAIVSLVSPYRKSRAEARELIGPERFVKVNIRAPLSVCERRDPKGLYARARRGEIDRMTGIQDPYEEATEPDLAIDAPELTPEGCVEGPVPGLRRLGKLQASWSGFPTARPSRL